MIEKLQGKKELLHSPVPVNEKPEARAARRAGQTDLQNDEEDRLLASNEAMGVEYPAPQQPFEYDPKTPTIRAHESTPKAYKPITVTREFNRPGDIATTDARLKTTGTTAGGTTGSSSATGKQAAIPGQQ